MRHKNRMGMIALFTLFLAIILLYPREISAHCDGMDGPVVKAAQKALETGNANYALIWVQKRDEQEVRATFQKATSVRKLNKVARELADRYFYETLVRLHRAGEGEPFTGLKPAGRDLGQAIPAADAAIESGQSEPLLKLFPEKERAEILERFRGVVSRKNYDLDDIEAGRDFVKAYVGFIHFVEELRTGQAGHD